jgi:hypothetical protein
VFRLCLKNMGLLVVMKVITFRRVGVLADEIVFSNVSLIDVIAINDIPYFSIDNAHLLYKAHPKLFRHFFLCIDNAHDANWR